MRKITHIFRGKISTKVFINFVLIGLVPLMTVSFVLVTVANDQLLKNASEKQEAVATDMARRVDNYLANNINLLDLQGRQFSNEQLDDDRLTENLRILFDQTATLKNLTFLTQDGQRRELVRQSDDTIATTVSDDESGDQTGALNFLLGKQFLITVARDAQNNSQIGIAIPILREYSDPTGGLFVSQVAKQSEDMIGVIAGYYDAGAMLESVISSKIGDGGYAYVVTNTGELVAHPDRKFLFSHTELKQTQAVKQFIGGNRDTGASLSEKNIEVISTPAETLTKWGVIVQEPVSSIYASVNSFIQMAATIGISAIILSILAGLFFSRQLVRPIRKLSEGARQLGRGEFEHTIEVKTKDELQDLANTFNRMGMSIKKLIGDLQVNNMRLLVEQAKLNNIISSVSDGVVALNSKGEIVSSNPPAAKMVGLQPMNIDGKPLSEVFKWEHDEKPFTPDLETVGTQQYKDLTLKNDKSVVYVDIMVSVLENKTGNVSTIITIHDQSESRELSFMKLDFVAIAAHELRTPLTVVRGYLDILNTSAATQLNVFQLENLQKAMVGANQLRELINKLLNIARIERGDMEIFIEKLNISKLVEENVEQHQPVADQKEQKITYSTTLNGDIYTPADTASIVEVLNNLIGNALKYTPKRGEVKVSMTSVGEFVRVEIKDNGPGVPDDMRGRLFTKFYRAERSLIAGSKGTGLGLFISKTIVELQGGQIGIEPDQGHGSVFYFTLPVYDPARDDERVAKNAQGGVRGWFKKRTTS